MDNRKLQPYFLIILLLGISLLTFFVFKPFLSALVLATVFAVIFMPLHDRIMARFRLGPGLAAFITMLIIIAFILLPLALLGAQIFEEALNLYYSISNGDSTYTLGGIKSLFQNLQQTFPSLQRFSFDIDAYLNQSLDWLLQNLGSVFSNFAKILLSFLVFLIALYYLLKDGPKLKKALVVLSPLVDTDDETIFKKLELGVNSVVRGNLTIALIQGILSAIGFSIFGVPSAILWGSVAAIAALIPTVGTALVLVPAVAFLLLTGKILAALGLLIWGAVAVGLVDNFLGPRLVGRGMQLHPLMVLLSVLGGLTLFGPVGFLIGPLTVSFLFALLDIYSYLSKAKS